MSTLLGCVFLLHAAYLSYEHHQVLSSLPRDIVLELVIGLVLLNFGAIKANASRLSLASAEKVPPLKKYLLPIDGSSALVAMKALGYSEHQYLDSRVDFLDVRSKRAEHLAWAQKH